MTRKTITELVDDLDGSAADATVTFGYLGSSYEIDLSQEHADAFEELMQAYTTVARKTSPTRSTRVRGRGGRTPTDADATGQIRAWARENGHEIAERGRISATVLSAYQDAQAAKPAASVNETVAA